MFAVFMFEEKHLRSLGAWQGKNANVPGWAVQHVKLLFARNIGPNSVTRKGTMQLRVGLSCRDYCISFFRV